MGKNELKVIFGAIIFMFSLALAYFTASYVSNENIFDYWGALLIFGVLYVVVGMVIYEIFAVSLGFLFAADVLIIHLLSENFGTINDISKAIIIGAVLVVLYLVAWFNMKDTPEAPTAPPPPASIPPIN